MSSPSPAGTASDFHTWAASPPLGWNSWDCFGTTVTEAQVRAQAAYLATHLRPHGWRYLVVDIQWYQPTARGHDYISGAHLAMDAHGRLIPAVEKFPSSADGAGFRPLADYVHSLGLRFGIHLMRGIPRQAVLANTPVLGTVHRAADIADPSSTCAWNPDMFGVDVRRPGGQAYYDSLFALYASWGVDYVKVDDIARPYDELQALEIEAIRRAIDRTGRPMLLSLSPGETPLSRGPHVAGHANLWRISDDFWDNWPALLAQFQRLHDWTPHRRPGAWPDADMLPLGAIEFGRPTRFTRDEQITLLTLWSIARSPLMHGGDLTLTDDFTLSLLTNDEVLAVNQFSARNHQLFRTSAGHVAWLADIPYSPDKYVALFNLADSGPAVVRVPLADLGLPPGSARVRDLWSHSDLPPAADALTAEVPAHGARLFRVGPA
ncbi:MAG: glycoside hydrolase family 27 protein [Opitutaceae bacterium]|jgi:hypothetical protein|nr:glycoside hydrolase family 27 protein [Opitutaceae bacterium]